MKNFLLILVLFAAPLAATSGIESYKKERDQVLINSLITRYKNDFPDADMFSDLNSQYVEMVMQLPDGNQLPMHFEQKISVFCVDGKSVGFVRIFLLEGAPVGIVAQIAVAPEYQHKGYGKQLLNKALEQLKAAGVQQVVLDSLTENKIAHALYAKVGFQKVAEGEGHSFFMMVME